MITRLMPKTAAETAAGVAIYVATSGLPTLSGCDGVAGAAPSPSCGGDLREFLRQSADMRQTTFGGRYVTAEDVARCVEAFNDCIDGGASSGGDAVPPTPSTAGGGGRKGLPQHFGINVGINYEGALISDCRINGDAVACRSINPNGLAEGQDSWTSWITGTLSGITMTGTQTFRIEDHYAGEPGCSYTEEGSGTIRFAFDASGTVSISSGPLQWQKTNHGSCSGGNSQTTPPNEVTATWSALE